jgi:hypothetical protein
MEGHAMLDIDYLSDESTYNTKDFRRRYMMNKELFMKIVHGVQDFDDYFLLKKDCTRMAGFSSIQKSTAAMRMLEYRESRDSKNEYLRMAKSTALKLCTNSTGQWWESLCQIICEG